MLNDEGEMKCPGGRHIGVVEHSESTPREGEVYKEHGDHDGVAETQYFAVHDLDADTVQL